MNILIYIACFLILISIEVESRRQRFVKSRKLRPRGQRHHLFKNVKSPKTSNSRKTTQVTKIVTVSDDGKETVKKFNHHDNQMINNWNQPTPQSKNHHQNHKDVKKFSNHGQAIRDFDDQTNHYPHNPINNHPPNPYPDFANPYPDGSYPFNSNFNPHPPMPPPHPIGEWIAPKFKEYTTECCNTLNVSSSDTSNDVIRGNVIIMDDKAVYISKNFQRLWEFTYLIETIILLKEDM